MAKLPRMTYKRFGANADLSDVGQFGGAAAGTKLDTKDIAAIQALPAWSSGWAAATMSGNKYPTRQERNGVDYVHAYQIDYMLKSGIPEYDSQTEYDDTSVVKTIENDKVVLYHSLINDNIGQDLNDSAAWEKVDLGGSSRNIGEIVASTIPLTDAGLHLLDGALLQYGSYQAFIDYIADLYDSGDYNDIFETEANWQQSVTTYGVCGKFVYDSVNNTVRLPKYSNKIYTQGFDATAPVVGNGMTLGLTNGSANVGIFGAITTGNVAILETAESAYGEPVGSTNVHTGRTTTNTMGVTSDSSKSGLIAQLSDITTSLDGYYYIVITTSTKTDIQVDIDQITTDLNGKADTDLSNVSNTSGFRKLIDIYNNGTSWYKVYAEYNTSTGDYIGKWCEQGGRVSRAAIRNFTNTITLLKPFKDTNYSCNVTTVSNSTNQYITGYNITSLNTNSFVVTGNTYEQAAVIVGFSWRACGYIN